MLCIRDILRLGKGHLEENNSLLCNRTFRSMTNKYKHSNFDNLTKIEQEGAHCSINIEVLSITRVCLPRCDHPL